MRRGLGRREAVWLVLGAAGLWCAALAGSAAHAQAEPGLPAPPALEPEIIADTLTEETVFPAGGCPTDRAGGHYVDEGFRLVVVGPCRAGSDTADVAVLGRGVSAADGDVSVAFKFAEGSERAGFGLYTRVHGRNALGAYVNAGSGEVTLFKLEDGRWSALETRTDGLSLLREGDWNRLSVRLAGSEVWLLLNDTPVLYAADVLAEAGSIGLRLSRDGRTDDAEPSVVIVADLLVAPLAGGAPERAPTYQRP